MKHLLVALGVMAGIYGVGLVGEWYFANVPVWIQATVAVLTIIGLIKLTAWSFMQALGAGQDD